MVETITRSVTDTYTEARARYLMGKVYDHLVSLYIRGIMTKSEADRMREEILYLMDRKAIIYFQLKFNRPNSPECGLHYEVRGDSTISMDDESGGLNFWSLDKNTSVRLLVQLNRSSPHISQVDRQLEEWGWGTGTALTGIYQPSKSFSKDGYGLKESIVGQW
jgi:hypothetical protein